MSENTRKNAVAKQTKKDRYTAVLLSQIAGLIIVLLVFNFFIKKEENAYNRLIASINHELFTVRDIAETVRDYFSAENAWKVSGSNIVAADDEDTESADNGSDEMLTGTGGDDLKVYEAEENTSFAPINQLLLPWHLLKTADILHISDIVSIP